MENTTAVLENIATKCYGSSGSLIGDCISEAGKIDTDLPHAPLLFIGGEEDQIIPSNLNGKKADAHTDKVSIVNFKAFPNRGHFICG